MAAKTRAKIKEQVRLNTGRINNDLENSLCDEALSVAVQAHPFRDAVSQPSDYTITATNTSVDISATTDIITVVTARIVDASGSLNTKLILKNRTWWDEHVINAEDNQAGRPEFGMRWGTTMLLDRPAESGLELRLRVSTKQTFTAEETACPIALLDTFVVQYVTAYVFKKLKHWDSAKEWKRDALGPRWDDKRMPGGSLLAAINADKELGEEMNISRPEDREGLAVQNLITDHGDYGNIRTWH